MKKNLFNPFEKYSEYIILQFAVVGNILLLLLSYQFNTQFVGNLKINPTDCINLKDVVIQHAIIISTTTLLLYLTGFYLNAKTRFIDILATYLLSRTSLLLVPLLNINNKMFHVFNQILANISVGNAENTITNNLAALVLFIAITLLSFTWFFVLLYNGFKTATNAKDSKSIFLFITAVLIIEISVRILINKTS